MKISKRLYFSIIVTMSTILSVAGLPLFAAPDLPKNVEKIANSHYFRKQAIDLLYDKKVDYQKAFACRKMTEQQQGSRLDVLCIDETKQNILTLSIVKSDNGYASYILVCPAGFQTLDPFGLSDFSFKEDPTNVAGSKGTMFYMGRTNGWIKDF